MNIGKWLGEFVNRIKMAAVIAILLGAVVAISEESGSAGAFVSTITVVAYGIFEFINWAKWAKGQV